MFNILKNDIASLLDDSLLCLEDYRNKLDASWRKPSNEIILSYHIFSTELLKHVEKADDLIEKISLLVTELDKSNDYNIRDKAGQLTEICVTFRKSIECFFENCTQALKDGEFARNSLINHSDILSRKIFALKNSIKINIFCY